MRGVTHAGPFQLDDLACYLVLKECFPELELVRSSDPRADAWIAWDIGGVYNHLLRRYDHHQANGQNKRRRPNGVPRAALGLIWLHYGELYCRPLARELEVNASELFRQVDRNLIEGLDVTDCGERDGMHLLRGHPAVNVRTHTLPEMVEALNPQPPLDECSAEAYDRAFLRAAEVVGPLLKALIRAEAAKLRAKVIVEAHVSACPVLVLDVNCNWQDIVTEQHPQVRFVVFPLEAGHWAVQAVAVFPGSHHLRRMLPAPWAGLSGKRLKALTRVPEAERAGLSRFRAIAASKEGATRLAHLALATD